MPFLAFKWPLSISRPGIRPWPGSATMATEVGWCPVAIDAKSDGGAIEGETGAIGARTAEWGARALIETGESTVQ